MKPVNPYPCKICVLVDCEGCGNKRWQEGFDACVSWLYEACTHSRGDFRDSDKAVTMCYRYACHECIKELEQ